MGRGPDEGAAVELLSTYGEEEASDRRLLRRAVVASLALHLALLAAPRPAPDPLPPGRGAPAARFELAAVRFAPLRPPPQPLAPAPEDEPPAPAEDEPAGPPGPPAVEILFDASDLSRLVAPRALEVPLPQVPPEAASPGEVRLLLRLDEEGRVLDVRVAQGGGEWADAAARAAQDWVFLPASLDGSPIAVVVEVVVRPPGGRARELGEPPPSG